MIELTIPRSIELFSVQFHLYGLIIGISLVIIYIHLQKSYKHRYFTYLFALQAISCLILGRLAFILTDLDRFINSPSDIFAVNSGGISIFGVILGFLLSSIISARVIRVSYLKYTDSVTAILPLAQSLGRLGNFVNQELFGPPTDLPWGVFIERSNRPDRYSSAEYFHPLFMYEAILNIISFLLIRVFGKKVIRGDITGIYFMNYGVIRILMNRLRLDQRPIIGPITDQDTIAFILILFGLFLLFFSGFRNRSAKTVSF